MKRVVVLGFDGFDLQVGRKLLTDLPNLREAADEGRLFELRSVYPPDSVPAWTTIYTGLPPYRHGIIDSIDYLDARKTRDIDATLLRGRTFWDAASQAGKRVCIVNPFMAYPAWPVNGIMVSGPVFEGGETTAHPSDILKCYQPPPLGGFVDFPKQAELGDFAARTKYLTKELARYGLQLLEKTPWDFFFICFLTIDRIQHFFWRYWDEADPTYPGLSQHSLVIPSFYKLYDDIFGQFKRAIGEDVSLLLISDHGHGRRCTKGFYVNELLRRKGYLKSHGGRLGILDPKIIFERAKNIGLRLAYRYDLEDWLYRLARIVPHVKAIKKSTYIIDSSQSIARIADFTGNNPFGGIEINRTAAEYNNLNYEAMRGELISALADMKDPHDGMPVVDWVIRREQLPEGEARNQFPDIVYQLRSDYGTQRAMYTEILGPNPFHRKISGGHRASGILVAHNIRLSAQEATLPDLRPTILDLLGIEDPSPGEGRSLVRQDQADDDTGEQN